MPRWAGCRPGSGPWGCRHVGAVELVDRQDRPKSRMENRLVALSIGLAALSLAAGYLLDGLPIVLLPLLALAASWLVGRQLGWRWVDDAGLVACAAAAAVGMWLGLAAGWMVAGLVAALSAWDLAAFARWLEGVQPADKIPALIRRHLGRLLVVDAVGVLLAVVALGVRLRLGLAVMLLLGLAVILGVSRAVRLLGREN